MKKIVYSNILKIFAVIAFIFNIAFGVYICVDGIVACIKEDDFIYEFETDFSESRTLTGLLTGPFGAISDACYRYDRLPDNENKTDIVFTQFIEQELSEIYRKDKLNYYIEWNGTVFTNCNASDGQSLANGDFYSYMERNIAGSVSADISPLNQYNMWLIDSFYDLDEYGSFVISVNVKSDYIDECSQLWARQAKVVSTTFINTLFCVIVALIAYVYLLCVCGKNKNGERLSLWVDNVWTEIHLAFIIGVVVGIAALLMIAVEELFYNNTVFDLYLLEPILIIAVILACSVFLTSSLSVIRNIKAKKFLDSTLVVIIMRFIVKITVKVLKWIFDHLKLFFVALISLFSKKSGLILISALSVYSFVIFLFGIFTYEMPVFILSAGIIFLLAAFFVGYKSKDIDEIKKGVAMIRNGNVSYKIPNLKSVDMDILANNINDIGRGLEESVKAQLKSERMKTELITNVSHDLKTPITSIINYSELLLKSEGLSEEARDYVNVISKKGERLKKLTQDLFDISKAQSGNENIIVEKIDLSVLIEQSLAENESDMKNSGLTFCVNTQKDLFINADGRKISRAVNNLINNIIKYSLKNTRVFISASEKGDHVIAEFKNISSYPMNFSAEEIVGRFVRGDESRTTDGNGLGLAIAKSYTELCGGSFEIVVDGDMFKAIMKFKRY
ncbi:MAG: HAMP domain-containing histidine kinase [Ruminococcaceae bacterium]|nr:HAMP domain-containing histidine kinase [Oscillospiraceae bacterium]